MFNTAKMLAAIQAHSTRRDEGASLVEYALLVALIAIVAVIAITTFGLALSDEYDSIATQIP
jgi:pilus assembly protein Flp/PilA